MLKCRPIRVKLILALTLLSAMVALLAFSGFWGLYHYQRLASAVSQRAVEIPLANNLHLQALQMRESHIRRLKLAELAGGMIELPLGQSLIELDHVNNFETGHFRTALLDFAITVSAYEKQLQRSFDRQSVLVNHAEQRRSLREIMQLFTLIKQSDQSLAMPLAPEMSDQLDALVAETERHLGIVQGGMRDFSNDVHGQYRTWITLAWICTGLTLVMMVVLITAIRSLVLKPFRTLLDGSRLVAGGQFDHRIDLGTGDELSELADAMNEMTNRFQGALAQVHAYCNDLDRQVQQRTREVIQNEQLASVGFLSAGVAHEINNPLASIAWSAESLQSRLHEIAMVPSSERHLDDDFYEALTVNLRRIEEEAYRCKGIIEKLLDFSRLNQRHRVSTDLSQLVSDVVSMVTKIGEFRCKTLRTHLEPGVHAAINPQEIRQVVLNLLTNALESVDCDGAVDVYVRQVADGATVVVKDDGCGMTGEVLQNLFEPFFTRRRDGTGTGLGLSITYRIVSQHGGSLKASSDGEGKGSQLELWLPLDVDSDLFSSAGPQITSAATNLDTQTPLTLTSLKND